MNRKFFEMCKTERMNNLKWFYNCLSTYIFIIDYNHYYIKEAIFGASKRCHVRWNILGQSFCHVSLNSTYYSKLATKRVEFFELCIKPIDWPNKCTKSYLQTLGTSFCFSSLRQLNTYLLRRSGSPVKR